MLNEIRENFSNDKLIKLIATDFQKLTLEYIKKSFNIKNIKWYYLKNNRLISNQEVVSIDEYIITDVYENVIIVPYDYEYVKNVRYLAENNIKQCFIAIYREEEIYFIKIENALMDYIKEKKYKNKITLNKLNSGDSNVYALHKYMPERYKDKYSINMIEGNDVFNIENIVKVPLISEIAISGHGTFLSYPYQQLMYNIEVGHGSMPFKACGMMEKIYKNFAFTPGEFSNANKVCATSTMDMILQSSFSWIPEDKFIISGAPRTDTLVKSDGRKNLEKLLKIKLEDQKVIFNMPTFHTHERTGKVDGSSKLNDFVKIENFSYSNFNKFLVENNLICIMKVHHAEENIMKNKNNVSDISNIHFISNLDLEKLNLDLYEILNAANLLMTDYSSIYSDFLFMNKPTVFINTDIDEYRQNRGLVLEPYDFWTAGPKVQNQENLHEEVIKSINDNNYYKEKREELRKVYHFNLDDKSSERIWDFIDNVIEGKV
jgi:CDP-glycerol glycerophosphotransferase (TagB/SpsB family)